jgi:hypothetical protein
VITQTQCTSFKRELYCGYHAFDSEFRAVDTFKIALYTSVANLDNTVTAYTTNGEITGTGYSAGGLVLAPVAPALSGATAYLSFANVLWSGALTANGALIYNSTQSNRSVCVLSFGSNITSVNTFQIQFPINGATTSVIRSS